MIEHAGKAIDALKGQPALLVLVLLNAAVFALIYFGVETTRQQQHEQVMFLLDKCMPGPTASVSAGWKYP